MTDYLLATIVPPDVEPADIASLLDAAATIHAARHTLFLANEEPITLFGAILAAGFGEERWPGRAHPNEHRVRAAEIALREHLGVTDLATWSDEHTPAEQLAALTATADTMRGGA